LSGHLNSALRRRRRAIENKLSAQNANERQIMLITCS
jgi:hypothetical protein